MNVKKRGTPGYIAEFAGTHKGWYILSVLLALISVICGFVPYVYMGRIVKGLLEASVDYGFCLTQCMWMGFFFLLNRLFHAASTTMSHKATFEVLAEIRRRLTKKLSLMPLGEVLSEPSGSYKNIIIERVDSIETTLSHIIPEVTANLTVPFIIFAYMMTIDYRLALISLIPVPLGGVFFMLMMAGSGESFENTIKKTKALNDIAVEYINGIEVIKAFGKAKTSYERFVVAAKEGADCFIEWMRRCNLWHNLALVLLPAQLLTLLPFAGWFYHTGRIGGPDALMMIILATGLASPFVVAAGYMDDISKMGAIVSEVAGILEKPELSRPDVMKETPVGNTIELKDVRFGYKDTEVLHGIDLTISEGTVNALVGPSGSGKSTIAKLIASFWDTDSGEICYGGVPIKDIPLEIYSKKIAYVSQDNYLFNETVMENIRLGDPEASDEKVKEAAGACGCHEFIMGLENGYETLCGGSGSHLSGGERQRISIARAMLKNAPVVILDEATAYTDPENEALVQRSVAKLVKGRTLIVIAHRLSTVCSADNIILVNEGRIEALGRHEELLKTSPLYLDMWNAHITVKEGA